MTALALRYWWVAVIAALLAALGVQTMRLDRAQNAYAEHLADDAIATAAAQQAARLKERQDQEAYDLEAQHARDEKKALEADVARLADTADGLRGDLAEFKQRARAAKACPAVGGPGKPGADPLDLLAQLYSRADGEAAVLARYAEELRRAGLTCERAADAVR